MAHTLLIKVGSTVLVRTTEARQDSNLKALRARFGASMVQPLALDEFNPAEAGARGVAVYRDTNAFMRAENVNRAVEAALLPDSYLDTLLASGNTRETLDAQYQGIAA